MLNHTFFACLPLPSPKAQLTAPPIPPPTCLLSSPTAGLRRRRCSRASMGPVGQFQAGQGWIIFTLCNITAAASPSGVAAGAAAAAQSPQGLDCGLGLCSPSCVEEQNPCGWRRSRAPHRETD